jgi:hypothetical protein
VFGRNHSYVFTFKILFMKTIYEFCTFSTIYKGNVEINFIDTHKKIISVKFDGLYTTTL